MLKSIHNTVIVFISLGFTMRILSGCDSTNAFYTSPSDSLISTAQCSIQPPIENTIDESTSLSDNHIDNTTFCFNDSLTNAHATVIAADDLTAAEEALRELIEAHPEYADEYAVYEGEIEAMLSELCELYTDPDTGVVGREWRFMWMAKRAEMIQAFVLQYGE